MQKVNNMPENTEDFVNNLLSQMTIEEKIGQLNQYSSSGNLDSEVIRGGNAGSVINASGALTGQEFSGWGYAAINNHIQQMALESRLKIPLIFGRDVIHGYRTVFPIPLAQAATFNPDMVEQAASVAAMEATADGIKWTFAPMIDIARDPRWGRAVKIPFLARKWLREQSEACRAMITLHPTNL
jgi:beta-glucosidase